jgi:hypothetical protein
MYLSGLSRDSVVGMATGYGRLATGWTTEGPEFESRYCQEFSLLHVVQTCSGSHSAS